MNYDKRHGGPYDRGNADAYYGRACMPHFYIMEKMMFSERVEANEMSPEEIEAYNAGYNQAVEDGDFKDWGR